MSRTVMLLLGVTIVAAALRLYKVDSIPPGLYIDEVSIGVNAYSIMTSGKDEHGVVFPLWFEAFGEYKLPVYIYTVAGSMLLFGKSEFSVRLPSILAGIASVPLLFLILNKLMRFKDSSKSLKNIPIIAAGLLAITPWHIHFSRGGFEATVAMGIFLLGVLVFIYYVARDSKWYLYSSFIVFVMSMYTYNAYRIIVPLFILSLCLYSWKVLHISLKKFLLPLIVVLIVMFPVIQFSLSGEGGTRFAQASAFADVPGNTINEKVINTPMVLLKNYLSYFSLNFIFSYGDQNGRHQVPGSGLLYRWEIVAVLIGCFWMFRKKKNVLLFLIFSLLLIAPIPAALTRPSPHALRTLLLVVPYTVLAAIGLVVTAEYLKGRKYIFFIFLASVALFESSYYLHHYFIHYSKINILDWGGGYKQIVEKTQKYSDTYESIVIDNTFWGSELYYQFYSDNSAPQRVNKLWSKPENLKEKKVLFIHPKYKEVSKGKMVDTVRIPNQNNDVFAEFYEL